MRLLTAFISLTLASTLQAQTSWTVSKSDPGANFTEIQAAVNSATSGDTLLIDPGFYSDFVIDGKGLHLVAEPGGLVVVLGGQLSGAKVSVVNLPAGRAVSMRGLSISGFSSPSVSKLGLRLLNNQGQIWLEELGIEAPFAFIPTSDTHAISAVNCDTVTIVNCVLSGGTESSGLFTDTSNVYAFGCSFTGGDGRSFNLTNLYNGGDGVEVVSGEFYAAESTFAGGDGSDPEFNCLPATDGGNAVLVEAGNFLDRTNTFTAGDGGFVDRATGCTNPDGLDGQPVLLGVSGTTSNFVEPSRYVTANSPVFEGQVASHVYHGVPGEFVLMSIGFSLTPGLFTPDYLGPFLIGDPRVTRLIGMLNGNGTRTLSFTLQELGFDSVTGYIHSGYLDPLTFTWRLGSPSAVTFMNSDLLGP
ncbi:MAG: hypothetical protein ACI8TQ_002139 [Planctomycetota bacterium]|jgi:hypothetical protein